MVPPTFSIGRLGRVHTRVPDRAAAARWFGDQLGSAPVDAFGFRANGFEGGPLRISDADRVRAESVETDGLEPRRHRPAELHDSYRSAGDS